MTDTNTTANTETNANFHAGFEPNGAAPQLRWADVDTHSHSPWQELGTALHIHAQRLHARWLTQGNQVIKRAFDLVVSLLLLLALGPLFLLIALAVWIEDGGPVFFAQTRVGQYGRHFRMFKVRSMCHDAEQRLKELLERNQHREGVTFKIKDDPRITRVGRWLRKFSFDELPQLYNVLLGDMSLVGPRPPVPREVEKYSLADRRRLAIKPGITCIWQISGRSEIDFSGQVKLDVAYIERQSFWFDLGLLFRTFPAVFSGKGAC
jgi:exopolysaccharide biosynthesis polyprenyl glycosylphosphotransferase